MKDIIVKDVVQLNDFVEVHISYPAVLHRCPVCNKNTRKVHDYRKQRIKDIPIVNKKLILVYYKRRYKCSSCNKNFFEKVDFIGRYQRITKRLAKLVITPLEKNFCMSSIANDFGISTCTVTKSRLFDCVSYSLTKLPEVLSIDEFKGNTEKGKYHCILVDPVNSILLSIFITFFKNFAGKLPSLLE